MTGQSSTPTQGSQGQTDKPLSDQLREKVKEANAQSEANRLSKGGK